GRSLHGPQAVQGDASGFLAPKPTCEVDCGAEYHALWSNPRTLRGDGHCDAADGPRGARLVGERSLGVRVWAACDGGAVRRLGLRTGRLVRRVGPGRIVRRVGPGRGCLGWRASAPAGLPPLGWAGRWRGGGGRGVGPWAGPRGLVPGP